MSSDEKYSCYVWVSVLFFFLLSSFFAECIFEFISQCAHDRHTCKKKSIHGHQTEHQPVMRTVCDISKWMHRLAFIGSYELNANNYINGFASIIHAFQLVFGKFFLLVAIKNPINENYFKPFILQRNGDFLHFYLTIK